ncbi:MAG: YIP1 family protein [Bacteroidota bacterium]|nr:YIP1 family protein [Bacteroidota bacterium]
MIWENFTAQLNVFIAPTKHFENLKQKPYWLTPFLVIAILTILVGYFLLPFKQGIMLSTLSLQLGEERARDILSNANQFALIGLIFTPIPLLIKWLVITAILYYTSILLNSQSVNFKIYFSVVVHVELLLLLMSITNIIILEFKGVSAVNTMNDLHMIIGLEYLLKEGANDIYLFTVLSNFNLFTIWYVIVLSIAFSIVSQVGKWKSSIIVFFVWLSGVSLQIAAIILATNLQKMMGK